jgi:hypothetical protein
LVLVGAVLYSTQLLLLLEPMETFLTAVVLAPQLRPLLLAELETTALTIISVVVAVAVKAVPEEMHPVLLQTLLATEVRAVPEKPQQQLERVIPSLVAVEVVHTAKTMETMFAACLVVDRLVVDRDHIFNKTQETA